MRLADIRSLLFVAPDDARRVAHAECSPADATILDLEDAVPEHRKGAARDSLVRALRRAGPRARGLRTVRINGLDTPHAADDLEAVATLNLDAIVVPKAEPGSLAGLPAGTPPVIALVETAFGVRRAYDTARTPGVQALMLGTVDLASELGATADDEQCALLFAASSVALDSVAAGLGGPIDGVCTAARDTEAVLRAATRARALGYRAKACIHPAQLDAVHAAFAPSASELEHARRVVAAYDEATTAGRGAVLVDGRMVDRPVAERARRLLA